MPIGTYSFCPISNAIPEIYVTFIKTKVIPNSDQQIVKSDSSLLIPGKYPLIAISKAITHEMQQAIIEYLHNKGRNPFLFFRILRHPVNGLLIRLAYVHVIRKNSICPMPPPTSVTNKNSNKNIEEPCFLSTKNSTHMIMQMLRPIVSNPVSRKLGIMVNASLRHE
jgi:hypothetical protein